MITTLHVCLEARIDWTYAEKFCKRQLKSHAEESRIGFRWWALYADLLKLGRKLEKARVVYLKVVAETQSLELLLQWLEMELSQGSAEFARHLLVHFSQGTLTQREKQNQAIK